MKKKINLIIDTDPGVDDTAAVITALYDDACEVKLLSTVYGNICVDKATKNLLYVLDVLNNDTPVVKGAEKPLYRDADFAIGVHGVNGTGNFEASEPTRQALPVDAIEKMYEVVKENKNNITILLLGPQTNMAKLLLAHPDVKDMISQIVCMGTSDYENSPLDHYISFNASNDPEALKIVIESGIPLALVTSEIGRSKYLNSEQIDRVRETPIIGEMMYQMYSGYIEPMYTEFKVALNDSCALGYAVHPKFYTTKKANVEVDTDKFPGKTLFNFNRKGNVKIVTKVNNDKFYKWLFDIVEKIK